jgi:hypothetical protein
METSCKVLHQHRWDPIPDKLEHPTRDPPWPGGETILLTYHPVPDIACASRQQSVSSQIGLGGTKCQYQSKHSSQRLPSLDNHAKAGIFSLAFTNCNE